MDTTLSTGSAALIYRLRSVAEGPLHGLMYARTAFTMACRHASRVRLDVDTSPCSTEGTNSIPAAFVRRAHEYSLHPFFLQVMSRYCTSEFIRSNKGRLYLQVEHLLHVSRDLGVTSLSGPVTLTRDARHRSDARG